MNIAGTSFLIQRTYLAARRGHRKTARQHAATHLPRARIVRLVAGWRVAAEGTVAALADMAVELDEWLTYLADLARVIAAGPGSWRYTPAMADDARTDGASRDPGEIPELPRHLAALVGALKGPSDLGLNHDKYLAYPDRDEASGAASA
jgi:hypothetical protein